MEIKPNLKYTKDHEWISIDGRIVDSHLHRFIDAQDFMSDDDVVPMGA